MARALQSAGKSVKLVELPTDADWWVTTRSRVQVLQEMDSFWPGVCSQTDVARTRHRAAASVPLVRPRAAELVFADGKHPAV
jgi:hypothetical protein